MYSLQASSSSSTSRNRHILAAVPQYTPSHRDTYPAPTLEAELLTMLSAVARLRACFLLDGRFSLVRFPASILIRLPL